MSDYFAFSDTNGESVAQQEIPHAVDAERALLGALLMNNDLFAELDGTLKAEFFYDKRHRLIYEHMYQLYDNSYADALTLAQRLRDSGALNEVGGEEYIADLTDIGAAKVNIKAYTNLVIDMAFRRQLISAHHDSSAETFSPGDKMPEDLLDTAEARLSLVGDTFRRSAGGAASIAEITRQYEGKIFANHKNMGALRGVHPGFDTLYKKTLGFRGGDLIILAGRPSVGKTAFGLNLVRNIAEQGDNGVLCFSLEMSAEQLVMRMLSHHGLDMHRMCSADSVSGDTLAQLAAASSKLENLSVHIDDSGTLNVLEARTRARRIKRELEKNNKKLGLIMVDYLQLMEAAGGSGRYDSRALEVSVISRGLKALAKELNTPIVALSQLNRSVEKRPDQRPQLSDLRESGAIEQDADLILFLHSKGEDDKNNTRGRSEIQLIIGKQRGGPTGTITMEFDKPLSKFSEVAYAAAGEDDGY